MVFSATTLAIASLTASVAGVGLAAYGQHQAGKAQEAAAEQNALNLEATARARAAEAKENTIRAQRESRRQLAEMRATMAGSGTQLDHGSNRDIMGAASTRLEVRIADAARGAMMEERALNQSASLQRFQGKQAASAGKLQMAGTLIGGFGGVAGNAFRFRDSGAI